MGKDTSQASGMLNETPGPLAGLGYDVDRDSETQGSDSACNVCTRPSILELCRPEGTRGTETSLILSHRNTNHGTASLRHTTWREDGVRSRDTHRE